MRFEGSGVPGIGRLPLSALVALKCFVGNFFVFAKYVRRVTRHIVCFLRDDLGLLLGGDCRVRLIARLPRQTRQSAFLVQVERPPGRLLVNHEPGCTTGIASVSPSGRGGANGLVFLTTSSKAACGLNVFKLRGMFSYIDWISRGVVRESQLPSDKLIAFRRKVHRSYHCLI